MRVKVRQCLCIIICCQLDIEAKTTEEGTLKDNTMTEGTSKDSTMRKEHRRIVL